MSKSNTVSKLVVSAFLVALQVILSRVLGIQTQLFQISLGFVPIAISAMLFGPVWASATALVADILGTVLLGTGAYNPLFSINAVLYALTFALFFYKKEKTTLQIVICVVLQLILIAVPLTPLWLYIYYNFVLSAPKAFSIIFFPKLIASVVEAPIKIAVLIPLCKYLYPRLSKMLNL